MQPTAGQRGFTGLGQQSPRFVPSNPQRDGWIAPPGPSPTRGEISKPEFEVQPSVVFSVFDSSFVRVPVHRAGPHRLILVQILAPQQLARTPTIVVRNDEAGNSPRSAPSRQASRGPCREAGTRQRSSIGGVRRPSYDLFHLPVDRQPLRGCWIRPPRLSGVHARVLCRNTLT